MIGNRAKEFLENLNTIFSNQETPTEEDKQSASFPNGGGQVVSFGASTKSKDKPTYQVVAQLGLTIFVVGLCLYVSINSSNDISQKLAFTGFGIVFGYWFG
jgi:hypothetical protein